MTRQLGREPLGRELSVLARAIGHRNNGLQYQSSHLEPRFGPREPWELRAVARARNVTNNSHRAAGGSVFYRHSRGLLWQPYFSCERSAAMRGAAALHVPTS